MLQNKLTYRHAIEVEGLVKEFGQVRAVNGVDLLVHPGTIYGVLGPNGAGKTTTINMLATLLKPDRGRGNIFGYDLLKEASMVRHLIGVTGQFASVDETLTARENLTIFSRLHGLDRRTTRKRTNELLEEFDLMDAADRPLSGFSGGMLRRLDLAVSLIVKPPLIFLDKPTTGLDPRTRNRMWDTIRQLVREGCTILLTTQYLEEADQLADRIALIDGGRVVAEGRPDELKSRAGVATLHLKLKEPLDQPATEGSIRQILDVESQTTTRGLLAAPMAHPEKVTDLLISLRQQGILLDEVSVQKPTLDEVFFTLTGNEHQTPVLEGAREI